MKIQPRNDQWQFMGEIYQQWNQGAEAVVGVAPTGFGKTVCIGQMSHDHQTGGACIIAHREELVAQISDKLAAYQIRHNIIGAEATRRSIAAAHVAEHGMCYLSSSSPVAVASVDTLVKADGLERWGASVTLIIVDEGHHFILENKWERATRIFTHPHRKFLLPTATPERPDGKGLGKPAIGGSGIADCMVLGPPMRWLIDNGHLCDYRIICVESDLSLVGEEVAASGDWSQSKLRAASERSRIVGDVVREYQRWVPGQRHITFCTDIETAGKIANEFRRAGIDAEALTGKTERGMRRDMLRRFAAGTLKEIVAVDVISEGYDLPAIEACSFARPSQSLPLVWQQFGRTLRTLAGKSRATIIDHVGNLLNPAIGLPDRPRSWSLANREGRGKRKNDDAIPMRVCPQCAGPFEVIFKVCPHCGHYEPPAARGAPQQVDGDLAEMSPELLAQLRGLVEAVGTVEDERDRLGATGLPHRFIMANVKQHAERLDALSRLRQAMDIFGGVQRARGLDDSQMQRLFFHRFGVDVLTAQTLKRAEAEALIERITESNQ